MTSQFRLLIGNYNEERKMGNSNANGPRYVVLDQSACATDLNMLCSSFKQEELKRNLAETDLRDVIIMCVAEALPKVEKITLENFKRKVRKLEAIVSCSIENFLQMTCRMHLDIKKGVMISSFERRFVC